MTTQKRVWYGCYALGIARESTTNYTKVHGLQSAGITTAFNLEDVFEIGQSEIYESVEDIPDVELTMEKVLDGHPLIYHLATQSGASATLAGRSSAKCNVAMSIFGDTSDSASGTPLRQVEMSGMYVQSLAYEFPVDGNFTESVTLVGNHKKWKSSSFTFTGNIFDNTDAPLSGVQQRKHLLWVPTAAVDSYTILPKGTVNGGIPGISSSGTNDSTADVLGAHVQRISVSTDLGREEINELGRRTPYCRYVNFPVDVNLEVEVIDLQGDLVDGTEEGVLGNGNNLSEHRARIVSTDSTIIDLGSKLKLNNVSYTGGETSGGNRTITFSYRGRNTMTVTHNEDPVF